MHDDDDGHTLLGIDRGVKGAMNAPRIVVLRRSACPSLPAQPNTNIGLSYAMQQPQQPQIQVSSILWVGEHEPAMCQDLRPPVHCAWEFVELVNAQFRDPAVEEVHEKKMFDLQMGKGPATHYFQELEKEAKLAGRRSDEGKRGVMVKAVRIGIPESYANFVAYTGFNVPRTYPEWKAHVIAMHKEHQKKWVFDQTVRHSRDTCPNPLKGLSTTSPSTSQKAGGATSSTSAKPMGGAVSRDAGSGRWMMFGGTGAPMDIGQLHKKGRCFRCYEKGHLGKDCPKKQEYKDIRSVEVATPEQEKTESKVEEVKE
ncbi:hypothetical protein ARMSODRAFT_1026678 [Armillaria solidipes]|uniref:CCHC-type domain-containing protein n=1 Tax=Armillaria solidipes TaxID=1076256 RepID=A0A2H3B2Q1_9AGAR|nr:hypothetical protein ARMSODRAFT_1026678 [Armillaria solidipes]